VGLLEVGAQVQELIGMRFITTISLLFILTIGAWAQSFPMTDEAKKDPSFLAFRQNLQAIVKKRDWNELLKHVDPQITYTYGLGKPGPQGFKQFWTSESRNLWLELGTALNRGGKFSESKSFTAPYYTTSCWPKDKDEQAWAAVVGNDVPVYVAADKKSRELKGLSYQLVEVAPQEKFDPKWTKILLPKDYQNALKIESGYIESKNIGRLLDYHAEFVKKNGRWWLTTFAGGC
jgi:hypothetical protein